MAAAALEKAAKALGHTIKVETQGSVGAKNQLTPEDIAAADAVVIAAETNVDTSRFGGKRLYSTSTKQAMHAGQDVLRKALEQPVGGGDGGGLAGAVEKAKADRAKARTGPQAPDDRRFLHAAARGRGRTCHRSGIRNRRHQEGHIRKAQSQLRSCRSAARRRFVCLLRYFQGSCLLHRRSAGHRAWHGGRLSGADLGAGFIGGIFSGFLAGYFTKFLADKIRLPGTLEGLKPVLILPFLSTLGIGLLMIYIIAPPVTWLNNTMNAWLWACKAPMP
jgi:PTS system fructose-specific IIC component